MSRGPRVSIFNFNGVSFCYSSLGTFSFVSKQWYVRMTFDFWSMLQCFGFSNHVIKIFRFIDWFFFFVRSFISSLRRYRHRRHCIILHSISARCRKVMTTLRRRRSPRYAANWVVSPSLSWEIFCVSTIRILSERNRLFSHGSFNLSGTDVIQVVRNVCEVDWNRAHIVEKANRNTFVPVIRSVFVLERRFISVIFRRMNASKRNFLFHRSCISILTNKCFASD